MLRVCRLGCAETALRGDEARLEVAEEGGAPRGSGGRPLGGGGGRRSGRTTGGAAVASCCAGGGAAWELTSGPPASPRDSGWPEAPRLVVLTGWERMACPCWVMFQAWRRLTPHVGSVEL